jgi:hypothetical protein
MRTPLSRSPASIPMMSCGVEVPLLLPAGAGPKRLAGGQTSLQWGTKTARAPSPLGLPEATTRVKGPFPSGAWFRFQPLDTCGWAAPRPTDDGDTQGLPLLR